MESRKKYFLCSIQYFFVGMTLNSLLFCRRILMYVPFTLHLVDKPGSQGLAITEIYKRSYCICLPFLIFNHGPIQNLLADACNYLLRSVDESDSLCVFITSSVFLCRIFERVHTVLARSC